PLQAGQVTRRVARVPSWWRVPVVIAAVAKPSQSRQTRVFEACWGMMRLPFRVRWIWKVRAVRGGGSLAREPPRRALASAVAATRGVDRREGVVGGAALLEGGAVVAVHAGLADLPVDALHGLAIAVALGDGVFAAEFGHLRVGRGVVALAAVEAHVRCPSVSWRRG